MKKTIIIVILVVYIASIAVVNFFGLAMKEFDGVEYVQEIKCNGVTVLNENPKSYGIDKINDDGLPEYRFEFIDGKYTKLTTTKELSYTAKSLKSGKKYFFKVRGYKTYKSGTDIKYAVYTPYSTIKYATAK